MPGPIIIDVGVTLNDQIEFNELLLKEPQFRRRRWLRFGGAIVLGPLLGLMLGVTLDWIMHPFTEPFPDLSLVVSRDFWSMALPAVLTVMAILSAIAGVMRLMRRRLLKRAVRRLLRDREGVDPNDPELREAVHCTFDDDGFATQSRSTFYKTGWSGIRQLQETPSTLIVRTGLLSGFVLPKRDIAPDALAAIRALAHERTTTAPSDVARSDAAQTSP